MCTLCDDQLSRIARPGEPALPPQEKVFKLSCGHQFHEPCIRFLISTLTHVQLEWFHGIPWRFYFSRRRMQCK
jgi:hypothetical protein